MFLLGDENILLHKITKLLPLILVYFVRKHTPHTYTSDKQKHLKIQIEIYVYLHEEQYRFSKLIELNPNVGLLEQHYFVIY